MIDSSHRGAGWPPYVLPFAALVLLAHLPDEVPTSLVPWVLGATALIPAALVAFFACRGAYPELSLRGERPRLLALDVLVGVASAALWVVPYLLFAFDFGEGLFGFLGPDRSGGFDPDRLGPSHAPLMLLLRMVGFVLVVPVVEELFIRSFVMRFLQGHKPDEDFRDLPIARYTRLSLWGTAAVFTLGHAPWEWWVALPWFVGTSLWFFYRGTLLSMVVVHTAANASIMLFVIACSGRIEDGYGTVVPLWYFL